MNKAFKLDKGNDSLHSVGGIHLAGQSLKTSKITEVFKTHQQWWEHSGLLKA